MNQQADAYNPQLRDGYHGGIPGDSNIRMQWMKTYAASIWIIDGGCQQMIEVHRNGKNHDQPCPSPTGPECEPGNEPGNKGMQYQMNDGACHFVKGIRWDWRTLDGLIPLDNSIETPRIWRIWYGIP